MITTTDLTTHVLFAEENRTASIAVIGMGDQLILQQLLKPKYVSEQLIDGDVQDLPKIVCDFNTVESVDVVIRALNIIRKNISNRIDPFQLAYAC